MTTQVELFGAAPAPEGFAYQSDFLTMDQESRLMGFVTGLPFENFQFHGFEGKRRVVSFGWRYDFAAARLREAEPMPGFLNDLRALAAGTVGLAPERIEQALVTEYGPGSAIGWHRDKPMYEDVIGVSLVSACTFRLRRRTATGWERYTRIAEPRSLYLLHGRSRTEWEHSIPPVDALRYSITFRTFRDDLR